jgi:oligopeptide/dipeptide ABC transporter ATP-binding protein
MSSFNPTMTIRGHFLETIDAHGMDREARMEHAEQLLKDLHLSPSRVMDSYPNELSGGMRQRALVALSLLLEPDVLVMDEPTAALDLLMQRSIISMLSTLQEEYDLTIVFITHDLPLVAGLVDRLAVLYAFEIVEIGDKYEMLTDAAHPYTRALIGAVTKIATDVDDMRPIEGYGPDPVNVPDGCTYHPRCPLATEICETDDPPLESIGSNHRVACFHHEQSEEAIPYVLDRSQSKDLEADLRPEEDLS